jgi:hypothetical protein
MKQLLTTADRLAYHAPDGAIHATHIIAGAKSMLAMRQSMTRADDVKSAAMAFGTAVHSAILQPDLFGQEIVVWDGGTRRGKAWDEFAEANAGKSIVKPDELAEIMAVKKAVMDNEAAAELISRSLTEVEFQWDGGAGVGPAKCLCDGFCEGHFFFDLKTTRDLSMFKKAFYGAMHYDIQFAWYWIGLGRKIPAYVIAVESAEPYDVGVWAIPHPVLAYAAAKAERIAKQYRECETSGHFPGVAEVGDVIGELDPPDWYFDEGEDVGGFPGLDVDNL